MDINFKDIENHYNGDDWRLFNHNDFTTVNTLDVKYQNVSDDDQLDQTDIYIQNVEHNQY
jgi:hypothetical protein